MSELLQLAGPGGWGWREALEALVAAFFLGQAIAWTYELTFRGVSYSRGFAQTLVLVCVAACTVMLAIGQSLVAGLGLIGVLSMIRFRTTLKSPRDLVFVMGAAALGIAAGVGSLGVALAGAAAFCGVAGYLHASPMGSRARFDAVLRFRVPSDGGVEPQLSEILARHCRRRSLLSVSELSQGGRVEHAYEVQLRSDADREPLLIALREKLAAADARLLLQDAAMEV